MNLKRAFLILMATMILPGVALAQDLSIGMTANVSFSDSNADETITVDFSCNDGSNPVGQAILGNGDSFRHPNDGMADNFVCTVTGSDVNANYSLSYSEDGGTTTSATPCSFGPGDIGETIEVTCDILATAMSGTFSVTKIWDISGAGSQTAVDQDVTLMIDCDSDISNPQPLGCDDDTLDSTQCKWTIDWDGLELGDSVTASVDVDTTLGDASCTAYETGSVASEVESIDNCESDMTVEAAGSNGCEITNTVFFEGIPTLSQYGMAIMVLLMLGVGFVGFRRFV